VRKSSRYKTRDKELPVQTALVPVGGEAVAVYSDVMKSHAGTVDGKACVSKSKVLVLQQELEANMGAMGQGKQTVVFRLQEEIDGQSAL
jgi:hypothetical protein